MKRRALLFALLSIGALAPSAAQALEQQLVDSSIRQLKKMSKLERDQFDRNLQSFQALSADQKEQYRKLHRDLEADHKEAGGGLTSLMETYSVWLMTLTPAQREELQLEKDMAKKIAIVRRYKEDQDRSSEHHDVAPEESLAQPAPKNIAKGALDKKDLDSVCKVLVDNLPFDRKKAEFDELGLSNYLPILQESILQYSNNHEWPGDLLLAKMMSAVRKETLKEINRSTAKRDAMIRMTLMGILKLASDQVHDPTAEERIQTALALSAEERARLVKLPPQQFKWALRKKYYESKGDEAIKQLNQLTTFRKQIIDLFDRLGVEPPPPIKRPERPPRGKGT